MNYKQKYEQALEYIRKVYPTLKGADKEDVEHRFPELKQNEGKRMIHIIEDVICTNEAQELVKNKYGLELTDLTDWLEKQSKQEQLYIRFGKIPTDEKSKIYQGEIEVGTENGVSVYPAFKTDKGDIVLGLSLPITKTTLYTQQHLIEYDDRPCYLVKGDYVGKDTDGQPLINNISIIEKIDDYRVKEEKQNKQKPADKVEPKFKVGDWINKDGAIWRIEGVSGKEYILGGRPDAIIQEPIHIIDLEFRLWTIQDAKDGDVLATKDGDICIFNGSITEDSHPFAHCGLTQYGFEVYDETLPFTFHSIYPATKEQRNLLFEKMKEAAYEWELQQ